MVAVEPEFCHQCGAELTERLVHGRKRPYCPACERPFFRNAVPSAGVFVRDGDAVLLMQQADRDSEWATGGEWTLPGGHPEYDESPREGAVRELEEETGLRADPDDLTLLSAPHSTHRGYHYYMLTYLLGYDDARGELEPGEEASDLRFWTPEEMDADTENTREIDRRRLSLAFDD
ncbi:NUDIX hydrolase [Halolamina sediminis]|jgi:ADP-ribose pyrophosphatase YjhB (NUDIX family)|uniref:NUDIX hydrolase n=1 Tax=Halolamina sediminis TaxID=1480675 RepID=UPI0006B577BF|nr:NUDIX hydrolase [Halolamina sediminis]